MSIWQGMLVFAALVGLVVDGITILRGNRKRAVAGLLILALLVAGLVLETAHVARVEAENRALTDSQARAQRLIDEWTNSDHGLDSNFNSQGANEGIASAAADLMEDVTRCRPSAAAEARQRIETARQRTSAMTSDDIAAYSIWEDAADAAFQQVLGVARVAPNC